MTLRSDLYNEWLTYSCTYCGNALVRLGSWFVALKGSFTCEACGTRNRFSYEEKQRLFDAHAKSLSDQNPSPGPVTVPKKP
jgi:RNase P subunit RPR2